MCGNYIAYTEEGPSPFLQEPDTTVLQGGQQQHISKSVSISHYEQQKVLMHPQNVSFGPEHFHKSNPNQVCWTRVTKKNSDKLLNRDLEEEKCLVMLKSLNYFIAKFC